MSGGFWRWQWEALRERWQRPRADVRFELAPHGVARPRAVTGELRVTWVGHATVLLQTAGANLLLDPIWSRRASPVGWVGPLRRVPPGVPLGELPPIDALLVTHDHYDHLDRRTIELLAGSRRRGEPAAASASPLVVTPTGYRAWMLARGVRRLRELGWGESVDVLDGARAGIAARITALPVRHWSRRSVLGGDGAMNRRSWCAYLIETGAFRVFFCGDSGYFDAFRALGRRVGPLDLAILPIGAYEPRWFMRDHHMNPEEAVRAFQALGASGACMGIHWGTFVLTDEPLHEPPDRMRRAWAEAELPAERLWIPRHGETRAFQDRTRLPGRSE